MSPSEVLVVSRRFDQPPARLFEAWTEPEQMERWFSPVGYGNRDVEADVRPGGRFQVGMVPPEGGVFYAEGTYEEISPPDRLVFTWAWKGNPMEGVGETRVIVEFRETDDGGTQLVLMHERLPDAESRAMHEDGWDKCLAHLDEMFAGS